MTWRDFFDRDHALYVNERHKMLHADLVAKGVAAHIPDPQASVLDYGCGEALGAPYVSERCGKLYLFDTAPSVRAKLLAANVNRPNISVLDDAGVAAIPDRSLDMIVVVSVLQYVCEDVSPIDDARALLEFGLHGGFLTAALVGLARTALSDYRTLRQQYGLSFYDEADMREILADHDFTCERAAKNIGHNQKRMTFVARKVVESD